MELIVKKLRSMFRTSIILSIIFIFIGIFLLVKPETTLYAISYTIGLILIVWGLFPIISFITNKESQNYMEFSFVIGVMAFLFGVVVMIKPEMIGSVIPLLMGIWMIINGATKLYYSIILNREDSAIVSIIISFLILLTGIVLVINPFDGAIVITQLIGISFIIYSVLDLMECFSIYKTYKNVKNNKVLEEETSDVKIVDVKDVKEKKETKNKKNKKTKDK